MAPFSRRFYAQPKPTSPAAAVARGLGLCTASKPALSASVNQRPPPYNKEPPAGNDDNETAQAGQASHLRLGRQSCSSTTAAPVGRFSQTKVRTPNWVSQSRRA